MFDKARQLYELQKKARGVQKELKEIEIEAKSGDGRVVVIFSGEQKIKSIQIDESLLTTENKGQLERTLEQTIGEAISRSQAVAAEKTKALMGDLGVNLPGM